MQEEDYTCSQDYSEPLAQPADVTRLLVDQAVSGHLIVAGIASAHNCACNALLLFVSDRIEYENLVPPAIPGADI